MLVSALKRWPSVWQSIVATTVCTMISAAATGQEKRLSHEARIPGRVLASLTIHDATASAQRCRESHSRRFGSVCERFLAGLEERQTDISTRLKRDIGISLEEFRELELGQITFASIKVPNERLAAVALLDFEQRPLMDRVVTRLYEGIIETGFKRSERTVDQTTITEFRREYPQREFAVCIHDNTLCLATNPGAMTQMLREWNTRSADTMPAPAYADILAHCHTDDRNPVLTWFVNPIALLTEVTLMEEPDGSEFPQFFLSMIPRLGLDKLKGIGGTFDIGGEECASIARTQFVIEKPRSGLLNMLSLQSDDLRPPAWMLQETPSYLAFHWDLEKFFEGTGQVLAILEGENALNEYLQRMSLLQGGLDLKRDIADRLTGRVTMTRPVVDGKQRWLLALQVRDPQQIAELIRESAPASSALDGDKSVQENDSVRICRRNEFGMDVCLALIGDSLLITDSEPAIQRTIAAASKREHIQVSLERAATCLPKQCLLQAFSSTDQISQSVYQFLRTETTPKETLGVDFSLLPTFDEIRPHIGPSAACVVENSAGVLFTHRSLYGTASNPPGDR